MASLWIDRTGPVVASSAYASGRLVARDVKIEMPPVTAKTSTYNAMGEVELPMAGQIDPMEAKITKIGFDNGLRAMLRMENLSLEFRWVQEVINENAIKRKSGYKAFIQGYPKTIPSISLEMAANSEHEVAIAVVRYQLFVDGEEYCLIDPLKMIQRIDGVDYCQPITRYL